MTDQNANKLSLAVVAEFHRRFPERGATANPESNPIVVIPAQHRDVGDILLDDDGDEVTIYFGDITHVHVGCHDRPSGSREWLDAISSNVCNFLSDVFDEKKELFISEGSGGVGSRGTGRGKIYVWSGPIS